MARFPSMAGLRGHTVAFQTLIGRIAVAHASCDFPQIRIEQRTFLTPSKRKLDVNIVQSNYHIELTPRCVL